MTTTPVVTVLMAVYNGLPFLKESLESVFKQTFPNFELLVIDDASTDGSSELLSDLSDPRLRVLTNKNNVGLAASLNRGLSEATGYYIARMDADDVCLPNRLKEQVAFLELHPEISLCGTWMSPLENPNIIWKKPTKHDHIKARLLYENCINHPSVMFRHSLFEDKVRYDTSMQKAQDYDLWERLIWDFNAQLAIIPSALVRYRVHPASTGQSSPDKQQEYADQVRMRQLHRLGIKPTPSELLLHRAIARGECTLKEKGILTILLWIVRLFKANVKTKKYRFIPFTIELMQNATIAIYRVLTCSHPSIH